MASAILPRTPAHGMTAACTRTTAPPRHAAAARPRSRASCVRVVHGGDGIAVKWVGPTRRSGFGRLRAEGPHSGSSKRGAMEAASSSSGSLGLEDPTPTEAAASSSSSDREAASEDGRAPAEPAADQAAPLLDRIASWATDLWVAAAVLPETYVVPAVGAIVSGAAVGGLPVAQPLAVLLLLVPCFCKKYSDWDASRVACNVELVSRHKREAAAQQAPKPVHLQLFAKLFLWMRAATQQVPMPDLQLFTERCLRMAELRTQHQQLRMRWLAFAGIIGLAAIATTALLAAAQLIQAVSPSLPVGWAARIVDTPSLLTGWPLAAWGACSAVVLRPFGVVSFDAWEVRKEFMATAAKRRAAYPVRPGRKP